MRSRSILLAALPVPAASQTADHLQCYKIQDPLRLRGVVDLTTPQFGLEAGCRISRPYLFCAPATKTVVEAQVDETRSAC